MKNKKAEGIDKIANEMVKYFPTKILETLLQLYNLYLENGNIVENWCEGLICPLYKENEKNNPDNYRGICISNALLKCLCLLLNKRLKIFCAENKLISEEQIGFREKSRTTDHIMTLKTLVNSHLTSKKGNKVFACFIDLKKAYDSIHHEALFAKLKKLSINGRYLNLIRDIYYKTKCAVKVNGKRTDFFNYSKGVRQGCPLSPILFNLYINGIVKNLKKYSTHPIQLDKNISCLLYADDLVIFSTSREGLQKSMTVTADFLNKWNLDINYDKTNCMTFSRRGGKDKHIFIIKGNQIKNVTSYKYLGITISSKNCSLTKTPVNLAIKANRAIFSLKSNLNLMKMPIQLLLKIFDTMIVPILLYGAEIWGPCGKYNFDNWDKTDVEKIHTSLLKQILGLNRSTQNIMVRAEFGRLPLIMDIHARTWQYIKYLKNKPPDTYDKAAYEQDTTLEDKCSTFKYCENSYREIISKNMKKSDDLYKISKKRVKCFFKNDYVSFWNEKLRSSTMSLTYATHKNKYEYENYLSVITIKKHRNSLAKLRMSDHNLKIHTGRQTRPKTPREARLCDLCPSDIEHEAHFLFDCKSDLKLKQDFINSVCIAYPDFAQYSHNWQKYKFIMMIQDQELLKSLGFLVNLLFKNRDSTDQI